MEIKLLEEKRIPRKYFSNSPLPKFVQKLGVIALLILGGGCYFLYRRSESATGRFSGGWVSSSNPTAQGPDGTKTARHRSAAELLRDGRKKVDELQQKSAAFLARLFLAAPGTAGDPTIEGRGGPPIGSGLITWRAPADNRTKCEIGCQLYLHAAMLATAIKHGLFPVVQNHGATGNIALDLLEQKFFKSGLVAAYGPAIESSSGGIFSIPSFPPNFEVPSNQTSTSNWTRLEVSSCKTCSLGLGTQPAITDEASAQQNYIIESFNRENWPILQQFRTLFRKQLFRFQEVPLRIAHRKRLDLFDFECPGRKAVNCLLIGINLPKIKVNETPENDDPDVDPLVAEANFTVGEFANKTRHALSKAMAAFKSKFPTKFLIFVVVGNDYIKDQLLVRDLSEVGSSIIVERPDDKRIELAFLTLCDHLIITANDDIGWWAGFLGKGEVQVIQESSGNATEPVIPLDQLVKKYPSSWSIIAD